MLLSGNVLLHKSRFLLISLSARFMCFMVHVGSQTSCADLQNRKSRFPPHSAARLSESCRDKNKSTHFEATRALQFHAQYS